MFATHDEDGNDMIVIRKTDLEDFPKLIQCLRSGGYGATTGIVKVRLHKDDRNDNECMKIIIAHLQRIFDETMLVPAEGKRGRRRRIHAFNIAQQTTFKGAMKDPVYEYVQAKSDAHRGKYITEVLNPASYGATETCCTKALDTGLGGARAHFFQELEKRSPYTPELLKLGVMNKDVEAPEDPILYAAGVRCHEALDIAIGDVLNMEKLGTIIDNLKEKYDGVAYPYLYCGTCHSFFCWHIEDGALCSINYFDGS